MKQSAESLALALDSEHPEEVLEGLEAQCLVASYISAMTIEHGIEWLEIALERFFTYAAPRLRT